MNLGKIVDKVYISEVNSNQDDKVVARCSVCGGKIKGSIKDLSSIKMHSDNGCLYCEKCFDRLFIHRHNQKLYREPF